MAAGEGYALVLSEAEIGRYRLMAEQARAMEAEAWTLAGIVAGARVADVGCGPGALLPVLAELVGPPGSVHAMDGDPGAVAAAGALVEQLGLANVTVTQGRADATGLPPDSVDVAMLRHVLAHNGGAEAAIVGHLASVVRPGGCVYLVDVDLEALRIRPMDADLADLNSAYTAFHRARGNDLSVGLRLAELLQDAGLEVRGYEGRYSIVAAPPGMRPPAWAARDAMVAEGAASADDVARWAAAFERGDALERRPILFAPVFYAVGRRPG
jgi:SAM-dependent methyltransferase